MEDFKILEQAIEGASKSGVFGNKDNYVIYVALQNVKKSLTELESLKKAEQE